MKNVNKDNLQCFIEYYHGFHDSYIKNINYNVDNAQIELLINAGWCGEITLNQNGYYETNATKIKMIFNNVIEFNNKEILSFDFINETRIKYIQIREKDMICLDFDGDSTLVHIIFDNIDYEEIK